MRNETLHVTQMEFPINWTTRMSRGLEIFLFTANLGRRFFLRVATDRWSRRDGGIKILVIETTKQTGERKEKLEENVLRETRTKGSTFRDASSFHPSSSSSSPFAAKTYIIRNRSLF